MDYQLTNNGWKCKECEKLFTTRQAVTSHIYRSHVIPGKSTGGGHVVGTPAWNKGLTKTTDKRVAQNALSVSIATKGKPGRPHTEEAKRKISKARSINNKGGKCKWFTVAGQKVQGTWERNVALKFEEMNIRWIKLKTNKDILEYVMNDKVRSYTPDFYLPDLNVYLEIKGRWWGQDKEKMQIVLDTHKDKKIVIVEHDDYKRILLGELVW